MAVLAVLNYDLTRDDQLHLCWHDTRAQAFWWVFSNTHELQEMPKAVSLYFDMPKETPVARTLTPPGEPCPGGNVIGIGYGDKTAPDYLWSFDYTSLPFALVGLDTYFPKGLGYVHLFPGRRRTIFTTLPGGVS